MTTTMDAGEEQEQEELGEGVGAGVAEEKISEGAQQPEIHQQPKHHDKKIIRGGRAGVSGGLPTNKNHFLGTTTIPTATSSFKTIPTVAAAAVAGPCGLSSSVWLLRSLCPQRSLLV